MIKKISLLLLPLVLLFSCYTQKIVLNPDKNSGQIIINYSLTDDSFQLLSFAFFEMSANDPNAGSFSPEALIDSKLFKEQFKEKETENIKLKSVKIDTAAVNNINTYKGLIVIEFNSLEKILKELPKDFSGLTVSKEGGILSLTSIINFKEMDKEGKFKKFIMDQKEDDIKFYNYLVKEAIFNFVIETAQPIKEASGIKLSNNNKRADYMFKLGDYIADENKIMKFIIKL
jgi:hypothetical protein